MSPGGAGRRVSWNSGPEVCQGKGGRVGLEGVGLWKGSLDGVGLSKGSLDGVGLSKGSLDGVGLCGDGLGGVGLNGGLCGGSGLLGGCRGGVGLVGIGSSASSSSCNAARRLSNCKRFSLDSILSSPSGFASFMLSYSSNIRAVMMLVTDGLGVPTELAVTVDRTCEITPGKGL